MAARRSASTGATTQRQFKAGRTYAVGVFKGSDPRTDTPEFLQRTESAIQADQVRAAGVRTLIQFFEKNPLGLSPGKKWTIYEVQDDGTRLYFGEGVVMAPDVPTTPASSGLGLSDAMRGVDPEPAVRGGGVSHEVVDELRRFSEQQQQTIDRLIGGIESQASHVQSITGELREHAEARVAAEVKFAEVSGQLQFERAQNAMKDEFRQQTEKIREEFRAKESEGLGALGFFEQALPVLLPHVAPILGRWLEKWTGTDTPGGAPNGAPNGQPNGAPGGQSNGQPGGQPGGAPNGAPNGQPQAAFPPAPYTQGGLEESQRRMRAAQQKAAAGMVNGSANGTANGSANGTGHSGDFS